MRVFNSQYILIISIDLQVPFSHLMSTIAYKRSLTHQKHYTFAAADVAVEALHCLCDVAGVPGGVKI